MERQLTNIDPQQVQQLLLIAAIASIGVIVLAIITISVLIGLTLRILRDVNTNKSAHTSPQALWVVSIICLVSLTACGPTRYLPIRILTPPVDSSGAISIGSVALWMRAGDEWIEVEVMNAGSSPVTINWEAAQFIEPEGRQHQLISATHLAEIQSSIRVTMSTLRAQGTFSREYMPEELKALARDLQWRRWTYDERWNVVIPAGNRWVEFFYPKEHIYVDDLSRWQAGPLFCNRVMVAEWLRGESFELLLPILIDGRWRSVRLVAAIAPDGDVLFEQK